VNAAAQIETAIPRLLTADQVAELLQVDRTTVYQLARARTIESIRLGPRTLRFAAAAVNAYLTERTQRRWGSSDDEARPTGPTSRPATAAASASPSAPATSRSRRTDSGMPSWYRVTKPRTRPRDS
jgi:excisionase family DNA binding protein